MIFNVEPINTYSKTFGLIGNLMCFPVFWSGIKYHDPDHKKPWQYFLVAASIYFIGEIIYAYYTDVLGEEPEAPSICDIFYFSNTLVCYIGLFYYIKAIQKGKLKSISFDMIISIFAVGGIIYNFVLMPLLSEENLSDWLIVFVDLYNPVFDCALLVGLLMFFFSTDNQTFLKPENILLTLAFTSSFTLDQFSLINNIYELNFDLMLDPLWSLYYMLLALASLYPVSQTKNLFYYYSFIEYLRITLPYIYTFTILFMVGAKFSLFNSVFLWAMILVIMLSLRQIFVLIGNKKLMQKIRQSEEKLNLQNAELQKLNQKIMHDAEVDFLTQLYNRRCIDKSFERLVPRDGEAQSMGVMLIDVDLFKHINDTFGHQVGDQVLQKVADSIRSVVRGNDIAGRFGGDEFIVLLPGADVLVTEMVTRNLIDYVHGDNLLSSYNVTLSIGCTSCQVTQKNYSVKNILKQADDALYKAKERGRNQYVVELAGGINWGDR